MGAVRRAPGADLMVVEGTSSEGGGHVAASSSAQVTLAEQGAAGGDRLHGLVRAVDQGGHLLGQGPLPEPGRGLSRVSCSRASIFSREEKLNIRNRPGTSSSVRSSQNW